MAFEQTKKIKKYIKFLDKDPDPTKKILSLYLIWISKTFPLKLWIAERIHAKTSRTLKNISKVHIDLSRQEDADAPPCQAKKYLNVKITFYRLLSFFVQRMKK
jgi:hypothetical protein